MNKENIEKLAATIEKLPLLTRFFPDKPSFSMCWVNYGCGAPSCIRGWAIHLSAPEGEGGRLDAADWLGLDSSWADLTLFFPDIPNKRRGFVRYRDIPPKIAARALRRVASSENYLKMNVKDVWLPLTRF